MTEEQYRLFYGDRGSPTASGFDIRNRLLPFYSGQPLNPGQLAPTAPRGGVFSSTDPGMGFNSWMYPYLEPGQPTPTGTGTVPPGGDQRAWAGTRIPNPAGFGLGTNTQFQNRAAEARQDLTKRFIDRAIREGNINPGAIPAAIGWDQRASADPFGGYVDPTIEPPPIPFTPGNLPHEAMDVPSGVYPPFQDLPVNPYSAPEGIAPNPWNEPTAQFSEFGFGNPYADVVNQFYGPTVPEYNPAPNEVMYPTAAYNPAPNELLYPTYPEYPAGTTQTYFPPPPPPYDFTGGPNLFTGLGAPTTPFGPVGPTEGPAGPYAYDPSFQPTDYPTPPGVEPDVLPANPYTNQDVPGVALSPEDLANMRNMEQFPEAPGLLDEMGRPTDWAGAGQFFKDAAGNIVDAAGKVIATASDFASKFGGSLANMLSDPGYSSPEYLASMGYTEGGGTKSMWPGQASGEGFGVGGRGGSFFGGTSQYNVPDISVARPGAAAGQVGSSSVQAPSGASGPQGGGSLNYLGAGAWGNALAVGYLEKIRKGLYPQRTMRYPSPTLSAAFMTAPGAVMSTPAMFRQGQIALQNFLRANPQWISQHFGGSRAGQGPVPPTSRHRPQTKPV